ncbi:SIR2 family protein [Chryseobacterium culicis]|uniref:SIR2 family protein n=1 Tax=Chryseobacterium culicis TaxID=680127 RepID=UPI0018769406|nr:SIR2 family protein [Chryseobacterium culicis]MBE4948028.1 SIR2 family protein [Chryseobacterium culicis]
MKSISFILGAGFSAYAQIADRKAVNEKLKNLKAKDFIISTVSIAYFIPENYPNSKWLNVNERNFIEYFIAKYVSNNPDFDYEKFYDYCMNLYKNHSTSTELNVIYNEYLQDHPYHRIDKLNSISILIRTVDQLIDSILYNDKDLFENGIIDKYQNFLKIIEKLIDDGYEINLFTLNHDLLLERLLSTGLTYTYADGFQYFKTPYFIKQGNQQIRISYYTKNFNSQINIFKLHGSIDNYIINYSEPYDMVKIPKQLNLLEIYREQEVDSKHVEVHLWTLYKPSFLSGDETKVEKYKSHNYYLELFKEFCSRLSKADMLISIGYGLMDSEINKMIFEHFPEDKKILVVKRSKTDLDFFKSKNVIHFGDNKELKDLTVDDIKKYL